MTVLSKDIRVKFLDFFKQRGHVIVPSSSLLSDDPSVLLTTAGVQQFKPYYTGQLNPEKDFGSRNTASVQKCFRTSDIDEVGDSTHLTFFEMMGNFSFGGYFKKEAITYAYQFITEELKISKDRLSATYLQGDEESLVEVKKFFPLEKIKAAGKEDNFWGPVGKEGPCGPTVEFYIDGVEVWNLVFNQYYCRPEGKLVPLKQKGVDTGMGLERLLAILQNTTDVYQTDVLKPIIKLTGNRIVADHIRGIVFLISDGVRPSNKEAGYVLRRLIRRVITLFPHPIDKLVAQVVSIYKDVYSNLDAHTAVAVFNEEKAKFEKTLKRGLRELGKLTKIDAAAAFKLYESYGLPFEVIKDFGKDKAAGLKRADFNKEFAKHQEKSRAGREKKFGGHGLVLDTGEIKALNKEEVEKVTRLHTATHLLQQALRDVLGSQVRQMGSDINAERLRFDFTFQRKLTPEEIKKIENLVNQKIQEDLPVKVVTLPLEEAQKTGALHFFKKKYPDEVKVYYIGDSLKDAYSKEFCGGPHVSHTAEIGKLKIVKEESVGAGVRRIRAIVN